MNQKRFPKVLTVLIPVVILIIFGYVVFLKRMNHAPASIISPNPITGSLCKSMPGLSDGDRKLVAESRTEIIKAGITAAYFDAHFCPDIVEVSSPSVRLLWKYTVNEYQMTFEDGWSTENNIHYILNNIKPLHDVVETIPKKQAEALVESCTGAGNIASSLITYQPLQNLGSRLHMVASSKGIHTIGGGTQTIKNARVDLESGKVYCSEMQASSGPR